MTVNNTDLTVQTLQYVWGHKSTGEAGLKLVSDFADAATTTAALATKAGASATTTALAGKVAIAGGTMSADPTVALGVATKQYVDASNALQSITATVTSNALTVGYIPQGPVSFRNPTLTSGAPVSATPSALSLVVPSGATLGTLNALQNQLMILLVYNAGTRALGIVNIAGGLSLDETGVISTTAISAGSASASVVYSTSAITNSPYRVVGFINAPQTTAGTWATAPSLIQSAGGQAAATMQSLGFGQSWQSVTRASGTTYYNTTSRPIMVSFQGAVASNQTVVVGGVTITNTASVGTTYSNFSFIVPPGQSYSITDTVGSRILTVELR